MANTVDKVIKIALAEEGYLEKKSDSQLYDKTANAGSGNYTKYGKEMHEIYPSVMNYPAAWCDGFVDWCFYKAYGVATAKSLIGGNFDDYTVASANMYKKKNAWYTSNPKMGDQIFFKNSTRICHTGLVYDVDKTYVYTVEGNTSSASGVVANGGCVRKKKYKLTDSSIAGYGRPKYDVEEPVKKPDVIYQVYANGKWWGEIKNYNTTNSNGYAGVLGREISGIRVKLSNGKKVTVRSHISGNARSNWLSEITKWDDTSNGYSGWKGKPTDCIAMKAEGCTLKYRVHVKGGNWLSWISKYDINDYDNGLAGIYNKPIDAVQITVV